MKDSGVAATSLQSVDKSATSPFKEWAAALAVIFAAALFAFFRGVLFKRLEEGDGQIGSLVGAHRQDRP